MITLKDVALVRFLGEAYNHRALIRAMALREIQVRYAGTVGGAIWVILHPLAVVLVFYFVFAIGFRTQGAGNTPYILWFTCGLAPWFFFNEVLPAITNAITASPYLVKKTVFPTEVLAYVQTISGLFPHAVFLLVVIVIAVFNKVPFELGRMLVLYYLFCTAVFVLALGWLLSALQVFYKDVSQGMTIALNIWFWITPIVWRQTIIPANYHWVIWCNPFSYIVEGYRGALIYRAVVWPPVTQSIYFWGVTATSLMIGVYVFGRLKPEFADVL